MPAVGERLIPLPTPTTTEGRGVDPICTRQPTCPFHEQTLEEAMGSGKAVAFIISTPQFCQTAICGPVLDLLIVGAALFLVVKSFEALQARRASGEEPVEETPAPSDEAVLLTEIRDLLASGLTR